MIRKIAAIILFAAAVSSSAQTMFDSYLPFSKEPEPQLLKLAVDTARLRLFLPAEVTDSAAVAEDLLFSQAAPVDTMPASGFKLPGAFYGSPLVFDTFMFINEPSAINNDLENPMAQSYLWLDDFDTADRLLYSARQRYMIDNPLAVKYNLAQLPEPPQMYRAFITPPTTKLQLADMNLDSKNLAGELETDVEKIKWIKDFNGSLQFSQAYISPNWYQGGNNSLNMIGQIIYHVKLNQNLYPKYLFELTTQYKLAMNSAPTDTVHSVNISEDIFQLNATFGLKATSRWYYSTNLTFKTQLFNSYPTNSRSLKAALLSPGELNVGVGMTYSYTNPKKTFSFGTSISPLSWNMKTCINKKINETAFGIRPGHKVVNEVGSNVECNLTWKIYYNIVYTSRVFLFTDYNYLQGDWENTISFDINRFLSTKIYAHLRYDSSTPYVEGSNWHRFQFKEILSFGFNYRFGTI